MGSLCQWTIPPEFVARFPVFVETGVGNGTSLAYAALHGFERLYSLEIDRDNCDRAQQRFADDPRVSVRHGASIGLLHELLTREIPNNRGIFFFLDAHCHKGPWDADPRAIGVDPDAWVPTHEEMRRIRNLRPDGNFAILIDDLNYFTKIGVAQPPDDSYIRRTVPQGLEFLDPFKPSHLVELIDEDNGFALLMPMTPAIAFTAPEHPSILK